MKGTVEQIWENESRNGQTYLTVQIGGERYSVWDAKYFDRFQQGAEVEYDFRQSGNFKNITEVNGLTGSPDGEPDQPMYHNDRDLRITRLSCLKSAAGIIAPALMEPAAKRDLVIDTARVFERYVGEDDVGSLLPTPEGDNGAGNG